MMWSRRRGPLLRLRSRRRVWAYGVSALVIITVLAVVSVGPMLSGRADVRKVQRDDLVLQQVLDLRATFADFQVFLLPEFAKLSTTATTFAPTRIATGSQIAQTAIAQTRGVTKMLNAMSLHDDARAINSASATFTKSLTALGSLIEGRPLTVIARTLAAEQATFTRARAVTADAAARLQTMSQADAQRSIRQLDDGRVIA